jgi:WD40 repeat protein/DNA-directed RNA polymerase specialized sigma24 family protein
MHTPDNGITNGFWGKDPLKADNPDDIELAFQLQNLNLDDPMILKRLVEFYGADLGKWIRILLYYQNNTDPTPEQYFAMIKETFHRAINHVDEFHGQSSVFNWLFGIGYQMAKRKQRDDRLKNLIQLRNNINKNFSKQPVSDIWRKFDDLAEKIRTVLILRYLFVIELCDIACILDISEQEVQQRLVSGRGKLFSNPSSPHMKREIEAYIDGLLDDRPDDLMQVQQHLESCEVCKTITTDITSQENSFREDLKKRWVKPALSEAMHDSLSDTILAEIKQPKNRWRWKIPVRQSAWIVALSLLFVGFAELFIRMTPVEREFPTIQPTATLELPPIIGMSPVVQPSPNSARLNVAPQYIEPAFSSDGKWAVFASIQVDPVTQMNLLPTIELYNHEANSIQIISESKENINLPWVWWNIVPSISADGRWIAYTSISSNSDISGSACTAAYKRQCLDIFLYDRESGETERITQSLEGTAANGDSFSPTVSKDGQWVAFWSIANNLVDGMPKKCEAGVSITCLFIYLYNQNRGKIEQIPIGFTTMGYVNSVDRISLSTDSRLVGFTVIKDEMGQILLGEDQVLLPVPGNPKNSISSPPSIVNWNSTEAIVYDRETRKYELENQTQDGILGNGDSSSPVLSADGQYVVFSSASTNLVPSDGNGFADVFLRDRTTGKIELISRDPNGGPSNGESGRSGWSGSFYSLDISEDGRYIVYGSLATNLSNSVPIKCNPTGLVCNFLYLHDREINSTELISDLPTYDFSYFPQITADGRWVSFMQWVNNCTNYQYQCSDVMLYDRQQAWTSNLTKSGEGILHLPWTYMGNLDVPAEIWERNALTFSPDASLLALAGNDSMVRIWQVSAGINRYRKSNPNLTLEVSDREYYTSVAFSPNGQWLAAGTTTRNVYIWKIPEGRLIYTLEGNTGPIKDLKFSPDGSQLVISSNQDVEIWQVESKQLVRVNSFSYGMTSVYDVAISSKGDLIASARGDGTVWLQSIPTGQVVGRLGGSLVAVSDMAFSLDGTLLATRSMEGKINLWHIIGLEPDALSISPLNTIWTDNLYGPMSFSPDNRYLVSSSIVGGMLLWGVTDGNIYTLSSPIQDGRLDSLAFSNLGDKLAATIVNGDIVIWGTQAGSSSTYFIHALWDDYGDSGPMPSATANDILMLREPEGLSVKEHLSLNQAAADLDFPLLVPTRLPENINFQDARVNLDGSAWLVYDASDQGGIQAGLYIYELVIGNANPPTMTVGGSAAITQIPSITPSGMDLAEYVQGDWSWSRYYNSQNHSHTDSWDWDMIIPTQRLRWQQQGIFIAMYYQVSLPSRRVIYQPVRDEFVPLDKLLTQQDLVQIAMGMKPFDGINTGITQNSIGLGIINSNNFLNTMGNGHIDLLLPKR